MNNSRNTIQKKITLDAVNELKNHPCAEEVYNFVHEKYPDISKATIYRNLNSLTGEGLINKISLSSEADKFDHIAKPHYHFKCVECGAFFDVDMPYFENINESLNKGNKSLLLLGHDIIFKGLCQECNKNKGGTDG